jgi:(p)ppGpp synthase/HD superfamily hydrolase
MNLAEKAKKFAQDAHNSVNHRRKYTDEPYHVHPERVANIVASVVDDDEMIAAAWLHDVLEDVAPKNSHYNDAAILQNFGPRVLALVLEMTDVSQLSDGNREVRKAIDRAHLAKASPAGQTIKLADMIDNIIDIGKHDKHFARVFRREALLSLPLLKAGDSGLYKKLEELLKSQ